MEHSLDLPDDLAERARGLLELVPFELWHIDALSVLYEDSQQRRSDWDCMFRRG